MSDSNHKPPEVDLETVVSEISSEVEEAALLVGRGFICGFDGYDRVGVIVGEGCHAGQMVWDGYLSKPEDNRRLLVKNKRPRDAATQLGRALVGRTTWSGRIDFFHGNDWSFAWSNQPDPFFLYTPQGRRAYVDEKEFVIEFADTDVSRWNLSEIQAVKTCISGNWTFRSIEVITCDTSVELISETDPTAKREGMGTPGHFDAIDINFEIWRFDTLAEDLADALGAEADLYGDVKL